MLTSTPLYTLPKPMSPSAYGAIPRNDLTKATPHWRLVKHDHSQQVLLLGPLDATSQRYRCYNAIMHPTQNTLVAKEPPRLIALHDLCTKYSWLPLKVNVALNVPTLPYRPQVLPNRISDGIRDLET
jgi:hypothetical protein